MRCDIFKVYDISCDISHIYNVILVYITYILYHCCCFVVVVVVVVVFTLNRSFYAATSAVPPGSFLILDPREIQIMWSQTVKKRKTKRR